MKIARQLRAAKRNELRFNMSEQPAIVAMIDDSGSIVSGEKYAIKT